MSLALLGELEEFWECQGRSSVRGNEKLIISVELNEWVRTARSDYEGGLGQYGDKRINEAGKLILEFYKERTCLWQTLCLTTNKFTCIHGSERKGKV